jgi:ABC-2 type transport system ATP-binding protein
MSETAIETRDLSKTYRDLWRRETPALDGVSLTVEPGTIFGLLGQNGAGKTTLVKILLSIVRQTGGSAQLLGRGADDIRLRRRIGYLPEQMNIPDYFRPESFLRYMGELNGVSRPNLDKQVPALLEKVGLGGVRKRVGAFSKGMRQRLGVAQALVNNPNLLFLDEPTEGLDPLGRKEIRDLLVDLRSQGKTIFLNSHLLSEIELVCNQVLILHKGRVAGSGTPEEFLRATGEYRLRLAEITDAVRAAVDAQVEATRWDGNSVQVRPHDRAGLNTLIDRLRAVPVEIEAIEPVRSSLEEFYVEVVAEETQ